MQLLQPCLLTFECCFAARLPRSFRVQPAIQMSIDDAIAPNMQGLDLTQVPSQNITRRLDGCLRPGSSVLTSCVIMGELE